VRASVPANLLLLGEYAVLEEGGLGLAVAVDPRVRISAAPGRPGAGLEVAARMDVELRWTPRGPRGDPRTALLAAAVEVCCPADPPAGTIEVDSSDFFFGGRKGGFGSSAAAAVGLCWALLALAAGAPPQPAGVLEAALAAHRRAQGGRGSGYDVFASFHGGAGLFVGGARPSWRPLDLPWLEPLYLFHGESSLSTPGAIGKYREWRLRRPGEARGFLEESNRLVSSFSRAASRGEALVSLRRCRELGLRLGEAIGVPASMQPPDDRDGIRAEDCKALGAGNELGLAFPERPPQLPPDGPPGSLRPASLASRGLAQERPE
jgi:phosphomevalonate kinase